MTISPNASTVWRNYETDGVPSSGNHKVKKSALRTWGTAVETVLDAFTTNGGLIFATKTLMDAQAATYTEPRSAWVYADSTAANNGVYVLNPGTDTWTKVGRLPYDFVIGTDTGAGTANAIQITTDIPVADGMIVAFSLFEATTASPVTVSINGGVALTLKTPRGTDASALGTGQEVWFRVVGSSAKMVNDNDITTLIAQAEDARDAAEAARDVAVAAASSIARYATRAAAAAVDLSGIDEVTVDKWDSASLYAPAVYAKVVGEPAHAAKFQSVDLSWWEIAEPVITSAMLGLVGDYDPVTRTGTNETSVIDVAFAVAETMGRRLDILDGVYYHMGELNYPTGHWKGTGKLTSQFYIEIDNTEAGGRVEAENVHIEDIGHLIYLTVGLGADDGEYGSGWTMGRYFTNGTPIATKGVQFIRCGAYVAPSSPFSPAHAFNALGRVSNVVIESPEADGFAGAAIHFHWGANGTGIGNPIVASYHPNNMRVRDVLANDCGRIYTLSSVFNVSIIGIKGTGCNRFGDLLPGDETNTYAVADEKPFVGSAIHISDFNVDGLIDISSGSESDGAMKVVSIGVSKADTDTETSQPTQRLLWWQEVVIENGKLAGADDISRGIDLTGAVGDIVVRDVDMSDVARATTGLRLADTRGNIVVDNVSIASALGIDWQRAWGARCQNMNLKMKNRTSLTGDLIALFVDGTEFSTTLTANKTAGATSISVAGFGAVLRPGDTIIVDGNHVKVAGTRLIRASETTIPIEAMAWTASSGATVACDQRAIPKLTNSFLELYDFGASISDCWQIDISANEFIDIAKTGVTGVAKSGDIIGNRFIRGGQHRLTDGAYASRNILLSAGSENVRVVGNSVGIDADYIDMCIQTSSDTGNLRVKDNSFGNAITSHTSFATQSNGRLDAAQFNEFAGNYRTDGGQLTGPSTWYEIQQNAVVRYHGTAAPTRGYHRAGSEWVNTAPTVGQPIGGMCTASGTPGTWVSKANL